MVTNLLHTFMIKGGTTVIKSLYDSNNDDFT